ncbi:MAG: NAD-dependent epimerase/dehydratase family protein [Bryobacteraceae bacterium]|nr:NAD-dependent epimerase/dehydratase family protein [Bryobacteraceae bacterium]
MKILVIGGTLFVGRLLVQSLQKAGHDVWIMHRKAEHDLGKKVGNLQADRGDAAQVKAALAGHHFDAVYDNVYDWDRGGTNASQVEATVRACGDQIRRYVFLSSVSAYGDGLNHHEGNALAPDDHPDTYIRNKAQTERMLFRMHQRYGIPVVTLRPPFIYGPGNPYYREAFFWDRLREGRSIIIPGDGRRLMQFIYVKDVVAACMKVLEEPSAVGHAFNISNPRPLTQTEMVAALAEAAGTKPSMVRIPRERILQAGGHPLSPPYYFGAVFDLPAITMVISKAQRVLGFKPVPFAEGLKETYRWYLKNRVRENRLDYSLEDRLLQAAGVNLVATA